MATVTISLPDQFAIRMDKAAVNEGFSTRSEFVRSLLRKYFAAQDLKLEVFEPTSIDEIRMDLNKTGKYSQKFIDSITKGLQKSSKYAR